MKKKLFVYLLCVAPIFFLNGVSANEGLDFNLAVLKINKEVKSLNNEILSLKDAIELLKEGQRLNSEKIDELLQIIELNLSNKKQTEKSIVVNQISDSSKLFDQGKSEFVFGNYDQAITLFIDFIQKSPKSTNIGSSKLWLARAYSENDEYIKSKKMYLEFQMENVNHSNYPNSIFELSKVLIKLNETSEAKILLSEMVKGFPNHQLIKKASQLLSEL